MHRRLTQESFGLATGQSVTNNYAYDNGTAAGLGVLTKVSRATTNYWTGGVDAFSRVSAETNRVAQRAAYGKVNGPASVSAALDGRAVSVGLVSGTNSAWPYQWRANLELTPGTHQIVETAQHPSGQFTTNKTSWFTNSAADRASDTYDALGNLTSRVWTNSSGALVRSQSLSWDALGRLWKITERDNSTNGYNWQAEFDALGRRVRTTIIAVTNGVALNSQPSTINHFYDPQVEFLEIGLNVNGQTVWKTYGPDLDGRYGGQQGLGGLEAVGDKGVIQDGFGNVLASVSGSSPSWIAPRVSTYAPAEGYAPPTLWSSPLSVEHLAWRGKWRDVSGYYLWGARAYDPERRAFLAFDPMGHAATPDGYAAFNGNPSFYWDADGRDPAFAAGLPNISTGLTPEQRVEQSKTLFPLVVAGGVSVATAGAATPVFAGWGLSGGALALASGAVAGASGDIAFQGTQMALGDRTSYSLGQTAIMTGTGGLLGVGGHYVGEALSQVGPVLQRLTQPAVTVEKVGDTFVKTVNPEATALAQWWGRGTLDAQAAGLQKLGERGAQFTYENGVMITQNAGEYTPGQFWSTWWEGTKRLGTPFNDIRPRNIGADGIIFDPSKHWLQQAAEATAVSGLAIYGSVSLYNNWDSNRDPGVILSKH